MNSCQRSVTRTYITLAQADALRRRMNGAWFGASATMDLRASLRARGIEYWIVRDDDSRVGTSADMRAVDSGDEPSTR